MLTGSIIDFYDDPTGQVLKQKLTQDAVPDFIKEASYLQPETRDKLPDDVFALVAFDRGERLRKYACTDKGNTALSVIYFMENQHKLPEEAQKVAAANLCEACSWYDMVPPDPLLKTAGVFDAVRAGLGKVRAAGKGAVDKAKAYKAKKTKAVNDKVNSRVEKEVKERVVPIVNKSVNENLKGHGKKIARGAAVGAGAIGAGTGLYYGGKAIGKRGGKKKTASAWPQDSHETWKNLSEDPSVAGVDRPTNAQLRQVAVKRLGKKRGNMLADVYNKPAKTASVLQPYVDITGLEPPPQFEKRASVRTAGHLPIDSYGEVMDAQKWFNENPETLHPEERRDFCIKLAARADELGQPIIDRVRKYAGEGFAPDGEVKVAVATRMQFWPEGSEQRGVLDGLMNKYASVQPDVFCEALRQFDEENGLDHYWDDGIYDPWYSTYGFNKTAQWEFSTHGDKITEEQLKQVVNAAYPQLSEYFGKELADGLRKSPVNIFDSLPLDSKRIIMRIVNDPQPSGIAFNA